MTLKACTICGVTKELDQFYPTVSGGTLGACKRCRIVQARAWAVANPEKVHAYKRGHADRNAGAELKRSREKRKRMAAAGYQQPRHKLKELARGAVNNALRSGKLTRPSICESCGSGERRIDAHHEDYARRLEVRWLCSRCHGLEHRL